MKENVFPQEYDILFGFEVAYEDKSWEKTYYLCIKNDFSTVILINYSPNKNYSKEFWEIIENKDILSTDKTILNKKLSDVIKEKLRTIKIS